VALREYLQETQETFERPDLEADDVLGILATAQKFAQYERILVSEDKDFRTIPGLLLNDGKARKRITDDPSLTLEDCIEMVTEAEADRHHLFQTLTGDTSDGYPGCPKAGPVTANKILDADCSWAAVVAAYEKQGLSEEVALTNARVARICRASDYDFRRGKVILWNPPSN
jgi:DNA polymerase-1